MPAGIYADAARFEAELGNYKILGLFGEFAAFQAEEYPVFVLCGAFNLKRAALQAPHTQLNRAYRRLVWLFDGPSYIMGPQLPPQYYPLIDSSLNSLKN